jgi:uncharacterized protein with FMN-binding domain
MRRITWWFLSTVAALVLLFSYRTSLSGPSGTAAAAGNAQNAPGIVSGPGAAGSGTGGASPSPGASGSSGSGSGSGSSGSGSSGSGSSGSGSSGSSGSADTVVNGTVSQTRWGPVQVQVRISGGKITEVTVLQQPDGNFRDQEINSYALPLLKQQVLSAQSASIDGVSGATVTSDGYRQSLQAALDAAHFKA